MNKGWIEALLELAVYLYAGLKYKVTTLLCSHNFVTKQLDGFGTYKECTKCGDIKR